jgi:hypothetical protein
MITVIAVLTTLVQIAGHSWAIGFAKSACRVEMYHHGLKQQCLIERAECCRLRPVLNHIGLCIRAFVRLESHCYREKMSWIQAKTSIIRDAVRAYLLNPRYLLLPTA